jgi:peptide/nickel transport system substrate-binding protein
LKKRIYLLLAILVVLSTVLVSCGSPGATPAPSSAAPASKPPVTSAAPSSAAPISSAAPAPSSAAPVSSTAAKPSATGPTPQYGGIFRNVYASTPLFVGDPSLGQDVASINSNIPSLEGLVFSENNGKLYPVLATAWTIAPDLKSITFTLRKGVKFHDGSDFNAEAAKWNMDRVLKNNPGAVAQWASVEVVDPYTIKLNLKSFQNTALNDLESVVGMQVSPTAAQKNGLDWMKTNASGTGPFKVKSFTRDVGMEYVRNDDYWGPKPYLDGIKTTYIADNNTARVQFESGSADSFSSSVDSVTADLVKKGYKLESRSGPLLTLVPDSKHDTSPLSKLQVRQAITYAIDRDSITKTLGYGFWNPAYQYAGSQQFAYLDSSKIPYKYDTAKAKQLLAAPGYPNGFTIQVIHSNTFSNADPILAIQSNLKDVGITLNITLITFPAWNDTVMKGWDNGLLWVALGTTDTNWAAIPNRFFAASSARYPVLNKSKDLTDLLNKVITTPDYDTEKAAAQQANQMMVDDALCIPVYNSTANFLLQKNINDTRFYNVGGGGWRWSPGTTWISK